MKAQENKVSLTGKAIEYLQKQFPNVSFMKDIILQDDGNGPYIKYWGLGTPKPAEAELNATAESIVPELPKPTIDEQLQMIYNDQKNNTKTFSSTMAKYYK